MTDRRRRAALRRPLSESYAGQGGSQWLLRERQSSSTPPSSPQGDDNPFAPPPEGRPDQPWQPRKPSGDEPGSKNPEDSTGSTPEERPNGGSQWSPRQPGRQSGGFGGPGGRQGGPEGPSGGNGSTGMRWDPTDPIQRRARYALLSGMWAFFFALFDLPEVALLLGALALYWGISSLRAKPRDRQEAAAGQSPAEPPAGAGTSNRPQTTAAVSGLVTAVLALAIVATTFTVQLVYRDYYTCVEDSLTQTAQVACNDLLPKSLRPIFGVKE